MYLLIYEKIDKKAHLLFEIDGLKAYTVKPLAVGVSLSTIAPAIR